MSSNLLKYVIKLIFASSVMSYGISVALANNATHTEDYFKDSQVQLQIGEYRNAHKLILQSIDLNKRLYGINHEKTAADFTFLGTILFKLGHYDKAKAFFLHSQNIRVKLLKPNNITLTDNLFGLAKIDRAQSKYQKALLSHETILEKRKASLSGVHPSVIESLLAVAELNLILAQYNKANNYLSSAEDAILYKDDKDNHNYSYLLTLKGAVAAATGDYFVAEMYQQSALDIQIKSLGRHNIVIANTLISMADRMTSNKKYTLAIPLYNEALSIYDAKLGQKNIHSAVILNKVTVNYLEAGELKKSSQVQHKAKVIANAYIDSNHTFYSLNAINQAKIFITEKKYSQAHKLYESALTINISAYGAQHPEVALMYANMADLYLLEKNNEKANAQYQKAVNIMQSGFAENHPVLLSIHDRYRTFQAQSKALKTGS